MGNNKRKKNKNEFDALIDNLLQEFSKIPNFDLALLDKSGKSIFDIVGFRMFELHAYRDLVCNSFIPATNKSISDAKSEWFNSKYKTKINISNDDFSETLYETIRLGYVGLFHKLENFVNDVIQIPQLILSDLIEPSSVATWAKEKFKFDIKDWQQFYITHKIIWICNCVKHKDGFPLKDPKPFEFEFCNLDERIKISSADFKKDCDRLIKFYPFYISAIMIFAQHKMLTERHNKNLNNTSETQNDVINKMEVIIKDFIVKVRDRID